MKRFQDIPVHTFSSWSNTVYDVVCPTCGKAGVVSFDRERNLAHFRCYACFTQKGSVQLLRHTA